MFRKACHRIRIILIFLLRFYVPFFEWLTVPSSTSNFTLIWAWDEVNEWSFFLTKQYLCYERRFSGMLWNNFTHGGLRTWAFYVRTWPLWSGIQPATLCPAAERRSHLTSEACAKRYFVNSDPRHERQNEPRHYLSQTALFFTGSLEMRATSADVMTLTRSDVAR